MLNAIGTAASALKPVTGAAAAAASVLLSAYTLAVTTAAQLLGSAGSSFMADGANPVIANNANWT